MLVRNPKLIITGGVGVGKTTTINAMCELLTKNNIKYIVIPEYIDGDASLSDSRHRAGAEPY